MQSRPRKALTSEIRTGGGFGDADFVCGSAQRPSNCVLTASTEQRRTLTTVHVFFHAAAQPTSYFGFMRVPFMEGSEQPEGSC